MLNKIFIMGRLTRDPELRRTQSGTAVTSFSLAVDRDFKSQSGEKETDFIDVVAWRSTAEFVAKYFTKGRMAVVEGRVFGVECYQRRRPGQWCLSFDMTDEHGSVSVRKYMDEKEHYDYILSAENQLCELIRKQDRAGSQDLLNRLLGHIFFYHVGNISDIKARTLELIVIISRSVISSGADVGDIFRYSAAYMQEIDHCDSVDQLSRWLSAVIEQFIAVSFDYADIRHSDIVFKTMDYIRSNCLRRITLEEIAGEVYLSKSYLSSIFKQETGMSITDYINQARVNHSKKLLTATAMPLIDIANECCFGDQSYFSRVFKKYQGVSPKKYRDDLSQRS